MLLFGVLLGLLAAMSAFAGTTSALIGLLFALAGGSLVGWYKKVELTDEQVSKIVAHIQRLSVGVIVGLGIGFGLKLADRAWIEPWLAKKPTSVMEKKIQSLESEIVDFQQTLLAKQTIMLESKTPIKKDDLENILQTLKIVFQRRMLADNAKGLSSLFELALTKPKEGDGSLPTTTGVFSLQSVKVSEINILLKSLDDAIKRETDNTKNQSLERFRNLISEWKSLQEEPDEIMTRVREAVESDDDATAALLKIAKLLDLEQESN